MKNKQKVVFLVLVTSIVLILDTKSQNTITLEAAIDSALKNNLAVKNKSLLAEYQKKMVASSANISPTNLVFDAGRINSYYNDNAFGINQSFSFPSVYSNQKRVLKEEWKVSVMGVVLKQYEVRKITSETFYNLLILREKEKLLMHVDSNYNEFLVKSIQRFTNGEIDILEKTRAELQRASIQIQLNYLRQEIELTKLQFQILLNSKEYFEPLSNSLKVDFSTVSDNSDILQHPSLKILQQQKRIAYSEKRLEQARLLPDFNIGYHNMTMRGTGSDNITYTGSTRFSSAQIGIGIPLFFGAQRAKINASKTKESIAENEFNLHQKNLEVQFESSVLIYQSHLQTIDNYEKLSLPGAILIQEAANKKFASGSISFLEWTSLVNQSVLIRNNYLESLKLLNESIISIIYLTSNK